MDHKNYVPSQEWLDSLKKVPDFWKGDVEDVEAIIPTIKKGRAYIGCHTPGGHPVYVVEYGEANEQHRKATYSSALGAGDLNCFSDKSQAHYHPCIYLIGCVHGGEFEGTVALLNLIQLIETGHDFAGKENPGLLQAIEGMHIILIPCVNPDGRKHVPFKSVLNMDFTVFRYYDQGMWANGTICDWPEVKRIHPIKDAVQYLGGYFNEDGINLMHDNFFHPLAKETELMLSLAEKYAPDFIVNFHGCTGCDSSFCDTGYLYTSIREKLEMFEKKMREECAKEGIPFAAYTYDYYRRTEKPAFMNLSCALHYCCGGISITHESQQGVIHNPPTISAHEWGIGHEEIYREHMICIEQIALFTRKLYQV